MKTKLKYAVYSRDILFANLNYTTVHISCLQTADFDSRSALLIITVLIIDGYRLLLAID